MLKYLSITNYALIDHLEIDFSDGFSAITGETGAGKSIILGALSLILGNRADLNNIKNQNSKCIIEGVFDNGGLQLSEYFLNNDLDLEAETILRRELLPSGKSRAFVNDTPVNLKMLGYLGNRFVNIHSQHQTLQLTDSLFQLEVLDDFVKNTELNLDYKDVFEEYQVLNQRLAELKELSQKSSRDEDYIKFQLDELNSHTLDPEIIQDLENRAKVLEHSEEIKLAISEAEYLLNDGETSLLNNMSKLKRVLDNVREYLPTNTDLTDRLNSILIELEDIGSDINSMSSNDDFDPSELQSINDSLSGIYTLLKKHHVVSVDELVELRDDFDNRLQGIESVDDNITATESKISSLEKRLTLLSNKLSTKRQEGAKDFAGSVLQKLKQLGMQDSNFVVSISKKDKFTSTGRDNVQLLFNANKG
ncbi:MAG: AAA family ATPase, partial [Lentimicrobiaceae bacterium]|nr:AAA family ATPase [Lentimicrobiaceae bacterium]